MEMNFVTSAKHTANHACFNPHILYHSVLPPREQMHWREWPFDLAFYLISRVARCAFFRICLDAISERSRRFVEGY